MSGQTFCIADLPAFRKSATADPDNPAHTDRGTPATGGNLHLHHFNEKELRALRGALGHLRVHDHDPEIGTVPEGIIPKTRSAPKVLGVFDRNFGLVDGSLEAERHLVHGRCSPEAIEWNSHRCDARAAYYLGIGEGQYGHFLLETLSRAWAWRAEDGLVPVIQGGIPRVGRAFYELIPGLLPAIVSPAQSMQFARVVVPHAAFVIGRGVHATLKKMCEQIAGRVLGDRHFTTGQPLYLSRTRLDPASRHGIVGENRLERFLKTQGFAVAHPQELAVSEQISLFNRHTWIVAPMGSACHTRLFARGAVNFIMLANPRFLRNFVLCDTLCKGETHYLNLLSIPDLGIDVGQNFWEPFVLREDLLIASLKEFGLVKPGATLDGPPPGIDEYAAKWLAIAKRQAGRNPAVSEKLLRAADELKALIEGGRLHGVRA